MFTVRLPLHHRSWSPVFQGSPRSTSRAACGTRRWPTAATQPVWMRALWEVDAWFQIFGIFGYLWDFNSGWDRHGSLIIIDPKKIHGFIMVHPMLSLLLVKFLPFFAAARLEASLIAALPNGLANQQATGCWDDGTMRLGLDATWEAFSR